MRSLYELRRRASAKDRILARLVAGPATNVDLNGICYRYGGRIFELRGEGHVIERECVQKGVWRYVYVGMRQEGRLF